MRPLACLLLLVVACSGSCSGDDAHKQSTLPRATAQAASPRVGATPAGAGPAAPAATPATPLTEAMAAPYWASPDERLAAQQFALEQWAAARASFEALLAAAPAQAAEDRKARLHLMIGLCAEQLADWPKAADHLRLAQGHLPLLSDFIAYHAANAAYFAHQPDVARTLAASVAPDSIVGADAEMLVGDLLRDAGNQATVAAHYAGYLQRRPHGPRRAEARFHLAQAKEQTGAPVAEPIAVYRQIEIEDPLTPWASRAHDRIVALARDHRLDAKQLEAETAAEHITRGMVLFDAMRNPESEAAFDDALRDPKISAQGRCVAAYHRAQSRFKARDRKGAAPMFDDAAAACKDAHDADLEIKSNYQAGRSYAFIGEHDTAIQRYQAAQTIDPKHSYADDALLREAEEWTSLGDAKQVESLLSALPTRFPDSDNVAEAMWRLGWHAWRDQKYDEAITWWQ